MESKEAYFEQAEIKYKNLIAYLYDSESESIEEIAKERHRFKHKIADLQNYQERIVSQYKELQEKFNALKRADDEHWEKAKLDFEQQVQYIENDRKTFIKKAEFIISSLNSKIQDLEEKTIYTASDIGDELNMTIADLKKSKKDIQEQLSKIKGETEEQWNDAKNWFINGYQSIKNYMKSFNR